MNWYYWGIENLLTGFKPVMIWGYYKSATLLHVALIYD